MLAGTCLASAIARATLRIVCVCATLFPQGNRDSEDHVTHGQPRIYLRSLDRTGCVQYDELMIAIRCSRVSTGEQFTHGPATILLDQEKIASVEPGHVELDESWQVVEYPNATVLPGLDTHVHLVADSKPGGGSRTRAQR
jgi:hypothetical protein